MVLIPNDAGIHMRMQTETALHPITPVTEIPADLVELHPGQAFSARIQEVLPENTYKALVAGRSLTLALPQGAKAGDTLELVVVDRSPHLVVAQLASRSSSGNAHAGADPPFIKLSNTAQLIGALLARDGSSPPPAALTRGEPLLAAASTAAGKMAGELAPQLAKAVGHSGLFYESHQVQWVMGQRPISDLLVEPQAKHSHAEGSLASQGQASSLVARPPSGQPPAESTGPAGLLQNLFGREEVHQQTGAQAANPAQMIPEDLRPLVQQQLDAAATQRLAWHGEVWPGQSLDWKIEPDGQRTGSEQADSERGWITSLRLTTPRLGQIDAQLNLTPEGARIRIATPTGASATALLDAAPALAESMSAAGMPLLGFQVKHVAEE